MLDNRNGLPFWYSGSVMAEPFQHEVEAIRTNNVTDAHPVRAVFTVRLKDDRERRHFSPVIYISRVNLPLMAQAAALMLKSPQGVISFAATSQPDHEMVYWLSFRAMQAASITLNVLPPLEDNPEDERRSKFYGPGDVSGHLNLDDFQP